ncbi:MAG: PIN domain nuclease [Flavobacteriaceae bacterium]|jgi:predicted nucleic acid-binding protein|nr:PIN domain nuclease [Flavobacteriaceae bacterium]
MILVDTSILIGYFKGLKGEPYDKLDILINQNIPIGICSQIYQEVLQGAKDEKEFDVLKKYLNTMDIYDLRYGKKSYENAARLYFECRKAGITPRSTIDVIIAQIAIENNLLLFHNDKDFVQISQVFPNLKLL